MVLGNVLHDEMEKVEILDYVKGLPYVYFWAYEQSQYDSDFPHERMKVPLAFYMNKAIWMIRHLEDSIGRNGYLLETYIQWIRETVYWPYNSGDIQSANKALRRINHLVYLIQQPKKVTFKLTNEVLLGWEPAVIEAMIWDLENDPISNIMEVVKSSVPNS